jgi:hypothetical protein
MRPVFTITPRQSMLDEATFQGRWFLPESPEREDPGLLRISRSGIELHLDGLLSPRWFSLQSIPSYTETPEESSSLLETAAFSAGEPNVA